MTIVPRAGIACAIALWLSGCNSFTTNSYQTMKLALVGPDSPFTVEHVNRLDRPALIGRIGQSEALLLRASERRSLVEWHGLSQHLVTHNGKLVHTAGLPERADVILELSSDDPFLQDLRAVSEDQEYVRSVDFPARYLTGLPQHSRYRLGPEETLEIMGSSVLTQRIDESISMPTIDFSTTNQYWVDVRSGRVVASAQRLSPDLPVLFLTEVIPAGFQP